MTDSHTDLDAEFGLQEFWSSLDDNQKHTLLSVRKESICNRVKCSTCKELLGLAIKSIEKTQEILGGGKRGGGSVSLKGLPALSRLSDGVFVAGTEIPPKKKDKEAPAPKKPVVPLLSTSSQPADPFVSYHGAIFDLLPSSHLEPILLEGGEEEGGGGGDSEEDTESDDDSSSHPRSASSRRRPRPSGQTHPPTHTHKLSRSASIASLQSTFLPCIHCADKFQIRFIDMLTYPRPIRKFTMLLPKSMHLRVLREMLWSEVGLESVSLLELRLKNRPLREESDEVCLEELGFKDNVQVVVSRLLGAGGGEQDQSGVNEKNKQFVGDLLFGQAPKEARGGTAGAAAGGATPSGGGGGTGAAAGGGGGGGGGGTGAAGGTVPAAGGGNGGGGGAGGGGGGSGTSTSGSGAGSSTGGSGSGTTRNSRNTTKGRGGGKGKKGSAAAAAKEKEKEEEPQPVSVIEAFRINGGYQILGKTIEQLAREVVHDRWVCELKARENERDLLASLEAEVVETGEDATKKKQKKNKKKEKEKKRKQEEAEKKRLVELEKEKEIAARNKAMQEKAEADRRARLEQQRREAEEEKKKLQEALELRRKEEEEKRRKILEAEEKQRREAEEAMRKQRQEQQQQQQQQQQAAAKAQRQQQAQKSPPPASSSSSSTSTTTAAPSSRQPSQKQKPVLTHAHAATTAAAGTGKPGVASTYRNAPRSPPPSSGSNHKPIHGKGPGSPPMRGATHTHTHTHTHHARPPPLNVSGAAPYINPPPSNAGLPSPPPGIPGPSAVRRGAGSGQQPHTHTQPPQPQHGGAETHTHNTNTNTTVKPSVAIARFCSQCGSQLLGNAPKFCSQCGSAVESLSHSRNSSSGSMGALASSSSSVTSPTSPSMVSSGWDPLPSLPLQGNHPHPHPPPPGIVSLPRSAPVTPRHDGGTSPYLQQLRGGGQQQEGGLDFSLGGGGGGGGPSPVRPVGGQQGVEEEGNKREGNGTAPAAPPANGGLPFFQRLRIG